MRIRYVAKRLASSALLAFIAITVNFLIFHALPGDAASLSRVPGFTLKAQDALREQLGLSKPILTQFVIYVKELAHFNLGVSFQTRTPVSGLLGQALLNSIPMLAVGTLVAIVLGVLIGTIAAWRRGTRLDKLLVGSSLSLYALPTQWVGLMLIALLGGFLPIAGRSDPFLINPSASEHLLDVLRHMILPATTLAIVSIGEFVLITRSALLDALTQDYILAARAKGLPQRRIVVRYGLRNAILPVITVVGLTIGLLASGQILIETVFSWPGIGLAVYNAVLERDYPVLQGAFLIITLCVVAANFVVDMLYFKLDPRVGV